MQHRHERLLTQFNVPNFFHQFFPTFLFLQQFLFPIAPSDTFATFSKHIFFKRWYSFLGHNSTANARLDHNVKLLPRHNFFQPQRHFSSFCFGHATTEGKRFTNEKEIRISKRATTTTWSSFTTTTTTTTTTTSPVASLYLHTKDNASIASPLINMSTHTTSARSLPASL